MTHTTNLGASTPLPEGGKSLRIPVKGTSCARAQAAPYVERWAPKMGRSIAAVCCSALVAALLLFLAYASTAAGNVYALGAFAIAFPVIAALGAFKSSVLPA